MKASQALKPAQAAVPLLSASQTVWPNQRISARSFFSDAEWDMKSAALLPGSKAKSWDFRTISGFPGGFALASAEYAYHRLYKSVASHDRTGDWLTVYNGLLCIRTFAAFCAENGCHSFAQVDEQLCYRFMWMLEEVGKSKRRINEYVFTIYRVWEYREVLSEPLASIPFGKPFENLIDKRNLDGDGNEAKTPVIPEAIYGPMMAAALDYVLDYSKSIFAARGQLEAAWEDKLRDPKVAVLSLSMKRKIVAKLGLEVTAATPSPWLRKRWVGQRGLFNQIQQLRRACIIVTLAYSGIRSSELLSLKAGCCVTEDAGNGRIRHYVNTVVHKHRGTGSKDTWVVIDEVVQAIGLLEELTFETRSVSDNDSLFLKNAGRYTVLGKSKQEIQSDLIVSDSVVFAINEFAARCNEELDRLPIPHWQDAVGQAKPWQFNVRQFRRTLARYIARQPFGIIAGMLQYKHVEVTCFEGYAGTEPEWNKMLEEEKVLASVNILDEIAIDLSHGAVAGELGKRLRKDFQKEFKGRAEDCPPSQIAKWLSSHKNNLFVGKFNFCFFDEKKALCIEGESKKDKPILNSCDPVNCSNACVGKRHAPLWQAQLNQANEMMKHPKASRLQQIALEAEVGRLKRVVQLVDHRVLND